MKYPIPDNRHPDVSNNDVLKMFWQDSLILRWVVGFAGLHVTSCLLFLLQQHIAFSDEPQEQPAVVEIEEDALFFDSAIVLDPKREDWIRAAILDGRSESWSRMQAERALTQRVSELQTECSLTKEQSSKLLLAGRGDIAKYFRAMEDLSRELKPLTTKEGISDFIVKPEVQSRLEPLQTRWRSGLHGVGSLYQGVISQTLSPEQIANIDSQRLLRDTLRTKQRLMAFVVNVERSIPLTNTQRSSLLAKLEAIHVTQMESKKLQENQAEENLEDQGILNAPRTSSSTDGRYAPMIAAMQLNQSDLEEFMDTEQVKTMLSLQRHWLLNVPLLNSFKEAK